MTQATEIISDDNGIEILVGYEFEKSPSQIEEGTEVGKLVYTELKSVEVVIAGRGINILPALHPNEKEHIISKLQYEAA